MSDLEAAHRTVTGAGQASAEESRQLFPLNHRFAGVFRVLAPLGGLVAAGLTMIGGLDRFSVAMLVVAGLLILGTLPGGNVTAAFQTGFGPVLIVAGLLQLGLIATSLNRLHATVFDACTLLALGLFVAGCGMYQWQADANAVPEQGRRNTLARDPRDPQETPDPNEPYVARDH